ncbi:hypothetical protein DSM104443_00979 [Usitatibacter rugosus]|uniref:Uncharacterized protein n=1 Tax=Usitatibacter rugosus TaxID=2732067 RepID=A0A6M4GSV9_9PROT|nr:hypothetical protein [Usitatibacter rugosus]QJR09928.1 hypothetical protein DSM104443_00979 [Usitatibacter rugosus]
MSAVKQIHPLLGAVLLACAPLAHADTLQLPNVRIVTPSDAQRTAMSRWDSQAPAPAFRAYKDPVSGVLVDQSPEEALKASGTQSKAAARSAPPITFTSPKGGVIMSLDDSAMSNSVVTRDASGRPVMQCVTGTEAALDVLTRKTVKEDRHDH